MAWKDRNYLDTDQYRDSSKLQRRALLHTKYGTNDWFGFVAGLTGFAPGMKVLDIGCGAGWFWEKGATRFPAELEITLADASAGMVDEALARLKDIGRWQQVAGNTANVCDMPFDDDSFDRVLAMHMLYHAEDKPAAIGEIARVLKPDGVALITTNGDKSMGEADALRAEAFGLPPGPAIDFTLESAPSLLEARFEKVELKRNISEMVVTDPEDVFSYLTSFPPGDDASEPELETLGHLIDNAFAARGGVLRITIDSGVFACSKPRL